MAAALLTHSRVLRAIHVWGDSTLLLLAFMGTYNLKSSFYITTLADQMTELFPSSLYGDQVSPTSLHPTRPSHTAPARRP